jgi:dipeptidyl-peptidase-3
MGSLASLILLNSCNQKEKIETNNFQWQIDRFEDVKVLRYQIPSWENLTAKQRVYAYHLNEAGLSGRDIIWDCNYRHNLEIRKILETIISDEKIDHSTQDYKNFEVYAKRVFFANGIHHHYSNMKFEPNFDQNWFSSTLETLNLKLSEEGHRAIFDFEFDAKKSQSSGRS